MSKSEGRSWRAWPAGLLFVSLLVGLVVAPEPYNLVQDASAQIGNCVDEGVCEGHAQVRTTTGGIGSSRCWQLSTDVLDDDACDAPTDEEWELEAGDCIEVRYTTSTQGLTPPAAAQDVTLEIRFDDTATTVATLHDGPAPASGRSWLACASGSIGDVVDDFASPDSGPRGLTWDDDSAGGPYLWNHDVDTDTIYKLNPSTGATVSSFASPGSSGIGLTWDDDSAGGPYLWHYDIATDLIYQLNPSTGATVSSFTAPGTNGWDLTWDDDSPGGPFLWFAVPISDTIYKLDPSTGNTVSSFTSPVGSPSGLTWDDDSVGGPYLWVSEGTGAIRPLAKVDPVTGALVESFAPVGVIQTTVGLAWDDDSAGGPYLWSAENSEDRIYKHRAAAITVEAGTYRLYVRAQFDGVTGDYDVDSDGNAPVGTASFWAKGALRSRLSVTDYSAPTPPVGSAFAYGAAGDEQATLSYTFTTINGDANVEEMRAFVRRTSDDAIIETASTLDADGNSFSQGITIDNTFDSALETYDACLELTGLSVLTGIRWTELSASGHDADLTRISDDVICDDDAFDADPRIVFSSDGAARDGDANANHDVYNRGESATLDFWLLNARDEQLTRSMDFMLHDASETDCLASTFTTTGAQYTESASISTTLCTAVNTATGSPWHVHASNTDQAQDSATALNVSTLYQVDSHPQLSVALSKDDFPTEDANEDFGYLIGSDTVRNWCHVEGVRLDDTEIDTGVGDVTITLFEPDGTQSSQTTRETGADGWTTSSFDVGAVAPAGVWQFECTVSFNGNTGTDSEGVNFVAQFTEDLRLRVIAETAVFNGGNVIPIYVHVEVGDEPTAPEIVPRITISRVNQGTTPHTWEDQTPESPMVNVVDHQESINGALYVFNWTVPSVTDEYNIRVRAQVNDSGVREMHNIEVISETDPDQVVIQENMLAVASFTGYSESESTIILLFLAMLLFSFFQRWLFVAIASVIGILEVMLNDPFGSNGFAFTLLLLVIGIMLQILVDMRDAHAEDADETQT